MKVCKCGTLTRFATCSACIRTDNQRRYRKAVTHGLHARHWRLLRAQVLARDDLTCQDCGNPATTVHLNPALQGNHHQATPQDAAGSSAPP